MGPRDHRNIAQMIRAAADESREVAIARERASKAETRATKVASKEARRRSKQELEVSRETARQAELELEAERLRIDAEQERRMEERWKEERREEKEERKKRKKDKLVEKQHAYLDAITSLHESTRDFSRPDHQLQELLSPREYQSTDFVVGAVDAVDFDSEDDKVFSKYLKKNEFATRELPSLKSIRTTLTSSAKMHRRAMIGVGAALGVILGFMIKAGVFAWWWGLLALIVLWIVAARVMRIYFRKKRQSAFAEYEKGNGSVFEQSEQERSKLLRDAAAGDKSAIEKILTTALPLHLEYDVPERVRPREELSHHRVGIHAADDKAVEVGIDVPTLDVIPERVADYGAEAGEIEFHTFPLASRQEIYDRFTVALSHAYAQRVFSVLPFVDQVLVESYKPRASTTSNAVIPSVFLQVEYTRNDITNVSEGDPISTLAIVKHQWRTEDPASEEIQPRVNRKSLKWVAHSRNTDDVPYGTLPEENSRTLPNPYALPVEYEANIGSLLWVAYGVFCMMFIWGVIAFL